MFVEDGKCSMEHYKRFCIQGGMGMEVLGINVWSCKIEIEKREEMKGRRADL